jgi:hypothetical protein
MPNPTPAKHHKKQKHKGMIAFLIILILGLLVILVALLPQFYIRRVEIKGNKVLTDREIADRTGIEEGKHLFYYVSGSAKDYLTLRYGKIEDDLLLAYPYIEDIKVTADIPYQVSIELKERQEALFIEAKDAYIIVDKNGLILQKAPKSLEARAPVVRGIIVPDDKIPGQSLSEDNLRQVERVLDTIEQIKSQDSVEVRTRDLLDQINYFFPYSAGSMYLEVQVNEKDKVLVKLDPTRGMRDKLAWLKNALKQDVFGGLGDGILDLTGVNNVFKPDMVLPEPLAKKAEKGEP